jgi:hypothetical protein
VVAAGRLAITISSSTPLLLIDRRIRPFTVLSVRCKATWLLTLMLSVAVKTGLVVVALTKNAYWS